MNERRVIETTCMHNRTWRTHIPGKEMESMTKAIDGWDVWRWPVTVAFLKRLGVDLTEDTKTTAVTVRLAHDEVVQIIHEYQGVDAAEETTDE